MASNDKKQNAEMNRSFSSTSAVGRGPGRTSSSSRAAHRPKVIQPSCLLISEEGERIIVFSKHFSLPRQTLANCRSTKKIVLETFLINYYFDQIGAPLVRSPGRRFWPELAGRDGAVLRVVRPPPRRRAVAGDLGAGRAQRFEFPTVGSLIYPVEE